MTTVRVMLLALVQVMLLERRASSLKVIRTGYLMHCLATVEMSVSGQLSDHDDPFLPMSGARLLTIEWE